MRASGRLGFPATPVVLHLRVHLRFGEVRFLHLQAHLASQRSHRQPQFRLRLRCLFVVHKVPESYRRSAVEVSEFCSAFRPQFPFSSPSRWPTRGVVSAALAVLSPLPVAGSPHRARSCFVPDAGCRSGAASVGSLTSSPTPKRAVVRFRRLRRMGSGYLVRYRRFAVLRL